LEPLTLGIFLTPKLIKDRKGGGGGGGGGWAAWTIFNTAVSISIIRFCADCL